MNDNISLVLQKVAFDNVDNDNQSFYIYLFVLLASTLSGTQPAVGEEHLLMVQERRIYHL